MFSLCELYSSVFGEDMFEVNSLFPWTLSYLLNFELVIS